MQLPFRNKKKSRSVAEKQDLQSVINELKQLEEEKIRILIENVRAINEETIRVFNSINKIADTISLVELNNEEEKYKSIIDNARKTMTKSLKRETSNIILEINTYEDFIKFKEKIESSINRFGEVSGSHSRIINTFMKKQAGMLKEKFKDLTEVSKEVSKIEKSLTDDRLGINQCLKTIEAINEKQERNKKLQKEIEKIEEDIRLREEENLKNVKQRNDIQKSSEYKIGLEYINEIKCLLSEEESLKHQVIDLLKHLSRAINKYAYGAPKETLRRIDIISNNPWQIFDGDIFPYIRILSDMREEIYNKKLDIKDSDKIIMYCNIAIESFPEMKIKLMNLKTKIRELEKKEQLKIINLSDTIQNTIDENKHIIMKQQKEIEKIGKEIERIKEETNLKMIEVEESFRKISGKTITISL